MSCGPRPFAQLFRSAAVMWLPRDVCADSGYGLSTAAAILEELLKKTWRARKWRKKAQTNTGREKSKRPPERQATAELTHLDSKTYNPPLTACASLRTATFLVKIPQTLNHSFTFSPTSLYGKCAMQAGYTF